MISATGRRHALAGRPVSAPVIRAGLLAGAGLRCCHAATSGGPASAASDRDPGQRPAGRTTTPAPPGIRAMARPAPITAAGPAAITAARAITAATCRSDPPRARSMVSSTSRRATIILAASRMTAAPTTIRLTNSSSSTVWMAAWVLRNSDRSEISGEVTVSVSALGASVPVSAGVAVTARLSALSRPCAWSAVTPPGSSGNSQFSSMPGPLNAFCIAASWSGSAKTPPTQNGMVAAVSCWSAGVPAVGVLRPEGRARERVPARSR